MSNLVRDPRGCEIITEANAGEPLIALVKGPPSWLRDQVATILKHMNIPVADIIAQNANSAVEAYLDKQRKGKKTKREQSLANTRKTAAMVAAKMPLASSHRLAKRAAPRRNVQRSRPLPGAS